MYKLHSAESLHNVIVVAVSLKIRPTSLTIRGHSLLWAPLFCFACYIYYAPHVRARKPKSGKSPKIFWRGHGGTASRS